MDMNHWEILFQHLRLYLDNSEVGEIQQFFDAYYSHIYFIVYEHFINTEQSLRQKGAHKVTFFFTCLIISISYSSNQKTRNLLTINQTTLQSKFTIIIYETIIL